MSSGSCDLLRRTILAAVIAVPAALPVVAQVQFDAPRSRSIGDREGRVLVVDANVDGHLDVVAISACADYRCEDSLGVLLGDGTGGFGSLFPMTPGGSLAYAASEDLDRDGVSDVVVVDVYSQNYRILVYRGDGQGGFQSPLITAVSPRPSGLLLADVNGDGNVDLLTTAGLGETLRVWLGAGTGVFASPSVMPTNGHPGALVAGDFDGDGDLDLAVATTANCGPHSCDSRGVEFLVGDGTGSFVHRSSFPTPFYVESLVAVDLDQDQDLDVAVAGVAGGEDSVRIFANDGTSGFSDGGPLVAGFYAESIVSLDFDEDGLVDLAVAAAEDSNGATSHVSLFRGEGSGVFGPPRRVACPGSALAVADFDEDGHVDILERGSGSLAVHFGDGAGSFIETPRYPAGSRPSRMSAADLNEDGKPDLIVRNTSDGPIEVDSASILLGYGSGGFVQASEIADDPLDPVLADFNEDGHQDLVCHVPSLNAIRVHFGDGVGGFVAGQVIDERVGGSVRTSFAAGDFDEDGRIDLAAGGSYEVRLCRGNGDGTFGPATRLSTPRSEGYYLALDWDGDGHLDLAGTTVDLQRFQGYFSVYFGDGAGGFSGALIDVATGPFPAMPAVDDFDSDGRLDALLSNAAGGFIVVAGSVNRTVRTPSYISVPSVGSHALSAEPADVDADGHSDIVLANVRGSELLVMRGDGAGGFGAPTGFRTGAAPYSLALVDVDRDGDVDAVTANHSENSVSVLRNRTFVPHLDSRRGNVNAGAGPIANVLFVNGSAGSGRRRRVIVAQGAPLEIAVEAPPSNPGGPESFVLWDWTQTPRAGTAKLLPRGLGYVAMPTPLTPLCVPQPRFVVNNVGNPARLGIENWPGPPTSPAPTVLLHLPNGVHRSGAWYLQGVIMDSAGPNGIAAVTNGIEVIIP